MLKTTTGNEGTDRLTPYERTTFSGRMTVVNGDTKGNIATVGI